MHREHEGVLLTARPLPKTLGKAVGSTHPNSVHKLSVPLTSGKCRGRGVTETHRSVRTKSLIPSCTATTNGSFKMHHQDRGREQARKESQVHRILKH